MLEWTVDATLKNMLQSKEIEDMNKKAHL